MLTPRKIEIFKAIVNEFVNTAEPVGSKTLIEQYNLPYSSATIRNEMSDLEKMGLLEKMHTSSGRVPSTKGYRFYVEHLMENVENQAIEMALKQIFSDRRLSVDEAIRQSCDILSQMTNLTSVVLGPTTSNDYLKSIQLIPLNDLSAMAVFVTESGHAEHRIFKFEDHVEIEDIENCTQILNERLKGTPLSQVVDKMESLRPILSTKLSQYEVLFEAFVGAFLKFAQDEVYMSGRNNMLYQPEFSNVEKLKQLTNMLEDSSVWRQLSSNHEQVTLRRNSGSELTWIDDVAFVSSSFQVDDDEERKLMVVGPSRMEYSAVVSMMDYVAEMIEEVYGKGGQDEQDRKKEANKP
ncbi:MAG TPA: heat-inducible transcriptional repressor HrcA [Erysipelothrix sp.]